MASFRLEPCVELNLELGMGVRVLDRRCFFIYHGQGQRVCNAYGGLHTSVATQMRKKVVSEGCHILI